MFHLHCFHTILNILQIRNFGLHLHMHTIYAVHRLGTPSLHTQSHMITVLQPTLLS